MKCCVKFCTNSKNMKNSGPKISFHTFPKQLEQRDAWLKALNITEWVPTYRTVVCSDHFYEDDIYDTKYGSRKLRPGALPHTVEKIDIPVEIKMCRVCLTVGAKTYSLQDTYTLATCKDMFEYAQMYEHITGIVAYDQDNKMPQRICWECAARLTNAATFRAKALLSDGLLHELLLEKPYPTLKEIQSLTQKIEEYGLNSPLTRVQLDMLQFDEEVQDICDDSSNAEQDSDHNNDKLHKENDVVPNLYLEVNMNKITVKRITEISEENDLLAEEIDIKSEKMSDEESEDHMMTDEEKGLNKDIQGSDDESNVNKKYIEVELEGPVTKKMKPKKERKPPRTKLKDKGIVIDKSLFKITPISHRQQIEEIQNRQFSEKYKISNFKCTVCFTGFFSEARYKTHMLIHNVRAGPFICHICKTRKNHRFKLTDHMYQQHSAEFRCVKCNFVTRHRIAAKGHSAYHAGLKYKCPHCPSQYEKSSTYFSHLRLKHMCDSVCELCGFTFVSELGLKYHKKRMHRLFDYKTPFEGPHCNVCEVKFLSQEAYDKHLRCSSNHLKSEKDPKRIRNERIIKKRTIRYNKDGTIRIPSSFKCKQCGKKFRRQSNYLKHFETDHPNCEANQVDSKSLAEISNTDCEEMVIPTLREPDCEDEVRSTLCEDAVSAPQEDLRKTCMCELCGKIFKDEKTLNNHTSLVHNFVFHQSLPKDKVPHEDTSRQFKCDVCGNGFTKEQFLKRHQQTHRLVKPYKCKLCHQSFSYRFTLQSHVDHVHNRKPWPNKAVKKIKVEG